MGGPHLRAGQHAAARHGRLVGHGGEGSSQACRRCGRRRVPPHRHARRRHEGALPRRLPLHRLHPRVQQPSAVRARARLLAAAHAPRGGGRRRAGRRPLGGRVWRLHPGGLRRAVADRQDLHREPLLLSRAAAGAARPHRGDDGRVPQGAATVPCRTAGQHDGRGRDAHAERRAAPREHRHAAAQRVGEPDADRGLHDAADLLHRPFGARRPGRHDAVDPHPRHRDDEARQLPQAHRQAHQRAREAGQRDPAGHPRAQVLLLGGQLREDAGRGARPGDGADQVELEPQSVQQRLHLRVARHRGGRLARRVQRRGR
mmetsp:Transcript_11549/g.40384  ORF Transcript_11549/g.40384 Transcript_11549/m.40384 type:complete len:315 (-) Transcript_11549:3690-4634(-)